MQTSNCPITIAGAGNPLLSFDRIGPCVLSCIENRYGDEVELCETGTNGLALLDIIHRQELLIVIDACIGARPPGSVSVIDVAEIETIGRGASVHQLGPVEALIVGRYLYPERMPHRSLLLTVDTNGLDDRQESAACSRAIEALDREIEGWRAAKMLAAKEKN
jgi:hydrogenase maturation protease